MKKIFNLLFVCFALTSCTGDLEINTDPNSPQAVEKSYVLTAAEGSLATVLGGNLTNLGGFFAQYHTQAPSAQQYLNIDTYNLNTTYAERMWSEIYSGCLNDLNYVITESNAEGDTGSFLIATLLKAYTFQVMTDLFGSIPYSEALQGEANISPKLDAGEVIYPDLIATIDQALDIYNADPIPSKVGDQDNIYDADMDSWVQFANTLKLKLYMRMSYTSLANAAAVNALLARDNFIVEDAKFSAYDGEIDKSNPFYDVQIDRLGDVNNVASNSLLSFYQENSDPRIEAVYRLNNEDAFRGLDQGNREEFTSEQANDFSRPNVAATAPVYLLTVSESNFLQAEALIRYAAGAGAAAKYNQAVINSFETYGLDAASAETLLASGAPYEFIPDADVETAIRQVMIQKWASLAYINSIEGFFELKRTKYPETVALGNQDYSKGNLVASVNSILTGAQTPNTLFYPDNETERNSNITQKASIQEKIWWDQK